MIDKINNLLETVKAGDILKINGTKVLVSSKNQTIKDIIHSAYPDE